MTLPVRDARLLMSRYRDALLRIHRDGLEPGEAAAIAAVALGCANETEGRTYNRLRKSPIVPMRGPGTAGANKSS